MKIFIKLFFLLTPTERKRGVFLIIMITIMALLDMIGIASILPFVAVLTNPSLIETNFFLKTMYNISIKFGVETNQEFLIFLGVIVFLTLIFSLTFKALTNYLQIRFVFMQEYLIGKRLVEGYLHQPYQSFLSRHSADLGKTILSEVSLIVGNGMRPLMELIAKSILTFAIIILLFSVEPKLTFVVGLSLGSVFLLVFYFVRNFLNQSGKERLESNRLRFTAVSEAFGAVKEVKIGGLEKIYIDFFSSSTQNFARTSALSVIIAQLPKFILEAIAFGGILLIILFKMMQSGNINNSLPIISLYIFAGYRLMPALQQIYTSLTQLTFMGPSIDKLHLDLKSLKPLNVNLDEEAITFNKEINLHHIHYNYPNTSRTTLKDINLSIPINSTVGLVGSTGCGKTTTIDIILGLLEPQKGTLEVDGKVITERNSRIWQRSIGYVPQHIYLSDDTIMANIAFGADSKDINMDTIKKVSKIANLHKFVTNELPEQYQTTVGERGIKLSGGQRQRIGIARALYHNPKVLVLDEATSALDNENEKIVMDSINKLNKKITIILISHRLNTVKNCDIIYKLDKGQLIGQGTYDELFNR